MNELITINNDTRFPVSGRELHTQLKIATRYNDWFPRMCKYGFAEERDFNLLKSEQVQIEGEREVTRETTDHLMTISMAKEVCMLQQTEKGKEVRRYLIEIETAWNEPTLVMARALKWADQQMAMYQAQLAEAKPKVEFYDTVTGSRTAIPFDQAAKVLGYRGMGRNNLFAFLRDCEVLQGNNMPYQAFVDRGYFRVVESKYTKPNGDTGINIKTLIYQKGLDYVRKLLDKAGYKQSIVMLVNG